jgi:FkbM family methyltransferase
MSDTRTLSTSLGHTITVFQNDYIGDKIARNGLYEKENLGLLLALLARMPDAVVLDVGANIGNHTLAFATGASQVHAFEPIPRIHALLTANVAQNRLDNVHIHNLALSDNSGTDTIHMVQDGNCGASSFDQRSKTATEAISVHKAIGDNLLTELGVTRVDLVKIDVEAHEVYVLRGLLQTLKRHLPVITLEWNDPLTIERLRGSPELAFLQEHYTIHVLGSNHDRGWWLGRPLAFVRRKLTRLLSPRVAVLHPFNPNQLYKNLLLVPKGREALLDNLVPLRK